jgi:hypothetical protein
VLLDTYFDAGVNMPGNVVLVVVLAVVGAIVGTVSPDQCGGSATFVMALK